MEIIEKMKITNRLGLHLRAAAQFVKTASKFKCLILVKNRDRTADGKSLINLMTLASPFGMELTLMFSGVDALEAQKAIRNLLLDKFGEKD